MRIVHIINSLETGGAERYLVRLANELDARNYSQLIVTLKSDGTLENMLHQGIRVIKPESNSVWSLMTMLMRLNHELNVTHDRVVCWMYKSHLFGVFIKILKARIVQTWLVRHSNISYRQNKIRTLVSVLLSGAFSFVVPKRIIFNSKAGIYSHKNFYCRSKMSFHPNFIDFPETIRKVGLNPKLLIMVCRYDTQKNIPFAMQVFSRIKKRDQDFAMKLIGRGMEKKNQELQEIIRVNNLVDDIELIGESPDPWGELHSNGVLLSTSVGEGFPNSVAEAVVRGCPVVATNVGETANIVSEFGSVLSNFEPDEFVNAVQVITEWTNEEYINRYASSLSRLQKHYGVHSIVTTFVKNIL